MRGRIAAAVTVLVAAGACGAEPQTAEGARDTGDVTRSLLSAAEADAASTKVRAPLSPQRPQSVDLDTLGFDRGSEGAPVRVIEMSDYGCGYCRRFHQDTWPVLLREYVESGKVEWKFLPFVTGMFANSPYATVAAECALEQGADQFEAMNARLWADQSAWKGSAEPGPLIRGWATEQRLDMGRFDSCVSENRRGERIAAANALTQQVGVRGTPTFFVVGYPPLQGALPTETFTQVLDLIYEDAVKRSGGGR